jgi:hypothetical protein
MPVILTTDEERVRGPESQSFAHEDELARPPDYQDRSASYLDS